MKKSCPNIGAASVLKPIGPLRLNKASTVANNMDSADIENGMDTDMDSAGTSVLVSAVVLDMDNDDMGIAGTVGIAGIVDIADIAGIAGTAASGMAAVSHLPSQYYLIPLRQ